MSSATTNQAVHANKLEFGPFIFDPVRRELRDKNGPVRAGSRSLQLLEVLLESPGRLYSREELTSRVWPRTVVEETSLRVHISALRRLLGDGQAGAKYITNVPGRGYAFVDTVRAIALDSPTQATLGDPAVQARDWLHNHLVRPIGRGGEIAKLGELLARERLVSIVGTGGIGKTTVALAVAGHQKLLPERNVIFADLSKLTDPALVAADVAQACGLDVSRIKDQSTRELENALRDQQALIVLDNCEHVIEAAADLATRLMRSCTGLRLLVTSREPLDIESEWVFRLPPLGLPSPEEPLDIEAVSQYPAIQLFVERARAACDDFSLSHDNIADARKLCEFLDGIPLAIELAAARVDSLGVSGILSRLESLIELLARGRRSADSRHRTLHGVMNWSYQLLTETERRVLQRVSVFQGAFNLDAAAAVAAHAELPAQAVIDSVLSLCQKSLVIRVSEAGGLQSYRLHHITRLFASKELVKEGDAADVFRRHAEFVLAVLKQQDEVGKKSFNALSMLVGASMISDLWAAVTWALGEENDMALGIEILAQSVVFHFATHQMHEARRQLMIALDNVARAGVESTNLEFKLRKNLSFLLGQILVSKDELEAHLTQTRNLAQEHGEEPDQIEALYAMTSCAYGNGNYLQALSYCDEIREIAQGEHAYLSVAVGDRLATLSLHALGQHEAAERLAKRVMLVDQQHLPLRFQTYVPYAASMGIQLARIYWLRGEFQRAWSIVLETLDGTTEAHTQAKCQVLALAAIPIALWKGERGTARLWKHELQQLTIRGNLFFWQIFATVFGLVLDEQPLDPRDDTQHAIGSRAQAMDMFSTLHPAPLSWATVARVQNGEVGWCAPEIMRRTAMARLEDPLGSSREACMEELHRALDLSVEQGARFWSLRIAISLHDVAEPTHTDHHFALTTVQALMNAIDDGSSQPDLQRARLLLAPGG